MAGREERSSNPPPEAVARRREALERGALPAGATLKRQDEARGVLPLEDLPSGLYRVYVDRTGEFVGVYRVRRGF